ncbi:hypothetical protein L218DRAFT_293602 [Marasmius fiardii PR-910]|nr:hypothetical protein L218DRAFT_293602 [Marasmius fiardii PR-910]
MSPSNDPVHPSAVGENTSVNTSTGGTNDRHRSPELDETYPPQHHAGAVGYGPNYHLGPTFSDKMTGLKEEVKGKITRHPDLVKQGHDRRTGEQQRREREEDMKSDPFADPEEKKEREQAANV